MAGKGSNKTKCANYKSRNSRVKNKIRKIQNHLKKIPTDLNAERVLKLLLLRV